MFCCGLSMAILTTLNLDGTVERMFEMCPLSVSNMNYCDCQNGITSRFNLVFVNKHRCHNNVGDKIVECQGIDCTN